jgi:integrase/recombinase XerC
MDATRIAHLDATTTEEGLRAFERMLVAEDASTATQMGYLQDLRGFFSWVDGVKSQPEPIQKVDSTDVTSYRNHLFEAERRKPSTVNRKLQALRRFYRFALNSGWRADDPTLATQRVRAGKRLKPPILTKREERALLGAALRSSRGLGVRNYALIQMMLQAGLRVGEVARLRIADVVLQPRSGHVVVHRGDRQRIVSLNAAARRSLEQYLRTREALEPDAPLFASERRGPLSVRSIQHSVDAAGRRAGIRWSVSTRALRHTFATRA